MPILCAVKFSQMKNIILFFTTVIFAIFAGTFIWILVIEKNEPQINILTLILIVLCLIGSVLSLGFLETDD
jgi:hypothetical protein